MDDLTLGQRIAQNRKNMELSQEALGEKLEVSRQAVSKWEADAAIPEIDKLIVMSKLFGISIGTLLGTEEAPEPEIMENRDSVEMPEPVPEQKKPIHKKWLVTLTALSLMTALTAVGISAGQFVTLDRLQKKTAIQMQQLEKENESLSQQLEDLSTENGDLTAQINGLESHIRMLQPKSQYTIETDDPEDTPSGGQTVSSQGPVVSMQVRRDAVYQRGDKFWLTIDDLWVSASYDTPKTAVVVWKDLQIVYAYKESIVTTVPLNLSGMETVGRSLSLQVPTLTFVMEEKETRTSHELYLQGTISIDGEDQPLHLPLVSCIYTGENQMELVK